MRLETNLLPKKLNDINYFKKTEEGCEIYSYNQRAEQRNEVIVVKLDFEIEHDFCIDSKAIDMLKKLNPADISITDKNFIIKSNKGKYTSRLLNEMLFNLAQSELTDVINVKFDKLVNASSYVSKNEKKPVLCGVRLANTGDIYSTDSFKAYYYEADQIKSTNGITIPVNFINLIKNIFNNLDYINLKYNNNIVMAEENNIKIYSRLIDGNYPDMEKIMSKIVNAESVELDIEQLKEQIEIASNVGTGDDKRTIVKFSNNKVEALGNDVYEAEIKFENNGNYELKLQLEILDQVLKTIDNPKFKVVYDSNAKMGIMIFATNEDETETCLILGIR